MNQEDKDDLFQLIFGLLFVTMAGVIGSLIYIMYLALAR